VTREEMGKLVFAQTFGDPYGVLWHQTDGVIRERCMLAAEAVDRGTRQDVSRWLRSYAVSHNGTTSRHALSNAADMVEARNTEGVE
jgi:hypothetical protein